ncbi:UNVERIFIED_CONTAM: hypothetical protein PYX00_007671 [Menopon gallinae]|uniref:Uncharacterized protein n=1 Tax=Menopon gallinae TaxID=328185 RepID=A0AAW2HK45_9NEOP
MMRAVIRCRMLANVMRERLVSQPAVRYSTKDMPPLCKETKVEQSKIPDLPPCPPPPPPIGPPSVSPPYKPPCPPPFSCIPDRNNPCNYVPSDDPLEPDLTKIKKRQCEFQAEKDIPVYLRGGRGTVYFFHAVVIMGGIVFINALYTLYRLT